MKDDPTDTDCSKAHPDAPHGFNRNASHSEDRYVCDCEGWIPPASIDVIRQQARNEALEEAASLCEGTVCDVHLPTGVRIYGTKCAAAIRSLIESKTPPLPAR